MRTFVSANIGLASFTLFWLMLDYPGHASAITAGLFAALGIVGWRLRNGALPILESGSAGFFAVLAVGCVLAPSPVAANALWLSFAGLGALALVSVALRRPWTAQYARAEYAAESESPIFHLVNTIVSAFWRVLFVLAAILAAGGVGSWAKTALFAFGALASFAGPNFLIRAAVQRQIDASESYRWPASKLGGVRKTDAVDVAIVGAGIGGLTAAALLADAGLKVAVYESHVLPGGFCHGFFRKARHEGRPCLCRFDAGPHDFSGLFPGGPVTSTLERLGVADRIEWRRLDHRYRVAGLTIDPPRDWREYARLLGMPEDFLDRVRSAQPAPSAFMVHLGVDYVPEGPPAIHVEDDFDCGVEILSKLDPTAAPAGHSTVGIIRLLPHAEARAWFGAEAGEGWDELRSSPDYAARKRELGDRLVAAAETVLPGLSRHIVYRSEASPVTYGRYDLSTAGAIYGVAGKGRLKGAKSPIPGLVVAGAATHGPGVEAVVISGALAAEALVPGLLAQHLPGAAA